MSGTRKELKLYLGNDMREETKIVYYADDGSMFEDRALCEAYEAEVQKKAKQTSYWVVHYNPDLTEGRGYCSLVYIEAYIPPNWPSPQVWLEDWCYKSFGRKLAFIQGVMPTESWVLIKIDREIFLSRQDSCIGSTTIHAKVMKLVVGARESGLLEYVTS